MTEKTLHNCAFLPDLLSEFGHFLQGCGWVIDGDLEVVSYDFEVETPEEDESYIDEDNFID